MPNNRETPIPWDEMKAKYMQGVPVPKLAEEYAARPSQIRARIAAKGWRTDRDNQEAAKKAALALKDLPTDSQLGAARASAIAQYAKLMGDDMLFRLALYVRRFGKKCKNLEEASRYERVMEALNNRARKLLGLDQQTETGSRCVVNIHVMEGLRSVKTIEIGTGESQEEITTRLVDTPELPVSTNGDEPAAAQ